MTDSVQRAGAEDAARASRAIVDGQRFGTLGTLAREPAGYPFGSLAAYALDGQGNPLLLLSGLAEHTANLRADDRASLLVCETAAGAAGPLAGGRVTLLGRVAAVPAGEPGAEEVRRAYLARHPEATLYLQLADFAFYRLRVESLRYVGGFGRMTWIDGQHYGAAFSPHNTRGEEGGPG